MSTANESALPLPDDEPARLSWTSFGLCMAILLAIFLFLNPIWESNVMGEWDQNIWWSYIPIPLLVVVFLRIERKLGWGPFWIETMKITFVKFTITFLLANGLWALWGAPGTGLAEREGALAAADDEFEVKAAPPATVLDPAMLGDIKGRVLDGAGQPVADALVYVSAGLDALHFEAPTDPAVLTNDGAGFAPELLVVQSFRELRLHSEDDALHTAVFDDEASGHRLLNVPVLAGQERSLMFGRSYGLLRVACSVHGSAEPASGVLALAHPFAVRTDEDGRFEFAGVPAGELELRALHGDRYGTPSPLTLEASGSAEIGLVLD